VAEPNGDVRIWTVSWEIAVYADAQYRSGPKTVQNHWRDIGRPSRCDASHLPQSERFLNKALYNIHVYLFFFIYK